MDINHHHLTLFERARVARISRRLWIQRHGIHTRHFHLNRRRQDISFSVLLVIAASLGGLLIIV